MEWQGKNIQRHLILFVALSFLLLTVGVISLYNAPVTGYEFSVYQSTPFIFWISIIVGLIAGILLFSMNYGRSRALSAIGIFEILLSNFILISMYVYRGAVYIERFDCQTYVGFAKDIVQLGYVPSYNFYPMGSILMGTTGMVTDQSMILMSQLFPAVFFTAYTVGILCWSRTISSKPLFVTSMMLAAIPIFFAWYIPTIYHETWCVLMLPLFFFILKRCSIGTSMFKVLAALIMIFFILGHPLVAVGALFFTGIILIMENITNKETRTISHSFVLYSSVILLGWIALNMSLVNDLQNVIDQLVELAMGTSTLGTAQGQASKMGLLSTIQSLLVVTIDDIIYVLLTLWTGLIILRGKWKTHPMTVTMACFLGGAMFLVILVLFTYTHNPFRMINLNFVMIFTIPLVGYLLYMMREGGRVVLSRTIAVVIVLCMVSTVFTLYQDPIEVYPNGAVSKADIVGTNWFITEKEVDGDTSVILTHPVRPASLIYGEYQVRLRYDDLRYQISDSMAHFSSFLTANRTDAMSYLVFSDYDVLAYTEVWAAADKYNTGDLNHLTFSTSIDHLYTNGCLVVYSRT